MLNALLVILVVFCGLRAIQAKRLVAARPVARRCQRSDRDRHL
jgi:hypothetical protein